MTDSRELDAPHIGDKDLRPFPRDVTDLLRFIINEAGCKWRPSGSGTILLFPPEGPPLRISTRRKDGDDRVKVLKRFIAQHGLEAPEEPQVPEPAAPVPTPRAEVPTPVQEAPVEIETVPDPDVRLDIDDDNLAAVRQAVSLLQGVLGMASIEHEALVAMEENDRLKRELAARKVEVDQHKNFVGQLKTKNDALTDRISELEDKIDALEHEHLRATQRAEKAEAKWQAFKSLVND